MASEVKTRSTVAAKSGGTGAVVHVTSEDDYKTKRATAGSNVLVVVDFSAEWFASVCHPLVGTRLCDDWDF
jgi:hypothetical protein